MNEAILRAAVQNGLPFSVACDAAGTDVLAASLFLKNTDRLQEYINLKKTGMAALLNDAGAAAQAKKWDEWAKKAAKIKKRHNLGYFEQACELKDLTPPKFFAEHTDYHYLDIPYAFGFRTVELFNYWVSKYKAIGLLMAEKKKKDGQ